MEEVAQLLLQEENENPMESLMFVDAIQRVGVDHHFEEEIEMILGRQYNCWGKSVCFHGLHDVSLFFRLLRQQGYYVSADVFNNFKGKDGKFLEDVKQDVRGLMALYEAAQLGFNGETIIDEAQELSRLHLSGYLHQNHENLCCQREAITNTLTHPQHKTIPRLTAKAFLHGDLLKSSKQWQKPLRELANMDFLIGKSTHQHELLQISKWWKDIGLAEEVPNARNQPIKWYTGSMTILINHPTLCSPRIELTKVIAFIHLLDDIFDLYGTIHQLTLFTHAIDRWDHSAIDMLPSYMRMSYKALLDTTNHIANNIQNLHGHNPIEYMKAADEHQDGQDGSYIDYYMKDEPKLSVEEARQHVLEMITNEWKNVNEECFRLKHYSSATCFKRASLNLARMVALTYGYDQNQRLLLLEEYVKTTLFN
ncbi:UNVERIFIED_CONTAM: Tricyclene synthase 0e23, chloroplastic [Sesamum latifolium]|uniref:Tricyclene synthase 0e23, chloroplastic n=1 Tax=Sesamum latifolium TaxID=2727402 RepID=A0AAW2X4M6_9LAMI